MERKNFSFVYQNNLNYKMLGVVQMAKQGLILGENFPENDFKSSYIKSGYIIITICFITIIITHRKHEQKNLQILYNMLTEGF
jgi:hypothetical protein